MERLRGISAKDIKNIARATSALTLAIGVNSAIVSRAFAQEGLTPDQGSVISTYFQCGGENYPDNHTILVQKIGDESGISFRTADLGQIAGQCNNKFMAPESFISPIGPEGEKGTPVSVGDEQGNTFIFSRKYLQCGGELGPMFFDSRHTVLVNEFSHPELGNRYATRNLGPLPGQCGNP